MGRGPVELALGPDPGRGSVQAQVPDWGLEQVKEQGPVRVRVRVRVPVQGPDPVQVHRRRVRCLRALPHHRLPVPLRSRDKEVGSAWWLSATSWMVLLRCSVTDSSGL